MGATSRWIPVFVLMAFCAHLSAQTGQDALGQLVQLPTYSGAIPPILKEVTKQTGIRFSYNPTRVRLIGEIQLPAGKYLISDLLKRWQKEFKITYVVIGNHVVLRATGNSTTSVTPAMAMDNDSKESGSETPRKQMSDVAPRAEQVTHQADEPAILTVSESTPQAYNDTLSVIIQMKSSVITLHTPLVTPPEDRKPERGKSAGKTRNGIEPVIELGLTTDDLGLTGPSLMLGVPRIYGVLMYRSNLQVNGFMAGIGTQLKLSERTRLLVQATTGKVSHTFHRTTDSVLIKLPAIGQMQQGSLIVQYKINRDFKVQIGFYAGFMRTKYGDSLFARPESTPLSLFSPLVSLKNYVSVDYNQSNQIWIGMHAALYYTLPVRKKKRK